MKKLFMMAAVAFLSFSCSSDDDSGPSFSNDPEANAAFDDSAQGIYKGVFVGSSGVVYVNINNDEDDDLSVKMIIDGTTHIFSTEETITPGESIDGLTFTNGDMSFDFYANADGSDAEIYNVNFPDHPNAFVILGKEYSDSLVEVFQGTYSGDDSGVFNLLMRDGFMMGLSKSNDSPDANYLEASMDSEGMIMGTFDGGAFSGDRDGDKISGEWINMDAEGGTWTGRRKL